MEDNEGRLSRSQNQPVSEDPNAKQFAALSYVWVFSLFMLLARRENGFIQHHARRGVVLFAVSLLFWWIPILHYGEILVLAICVMGFIKASTGNEFNIPLLSEIADGSMRRKEIEGYRNGVRPEYQRPKEGPDKVTALEDRVRRDEEEIRKLEEEVRRLEAEIRKPNN